MYTLNVRISASGEAAQMLAVLEAIHAIPEIKDGLVNGSVDGTISHTGKIGPPTVATVYSLDTPIAEFIPKNEPGSGRARNCLERAGITTLGLLIEKSREDLYEIQNFGDKSIDMLERLLVKAGFQLKSD